MVDARTTAGTHEAEVARLRAGLEAALAAAREDLLRTHRQYRRDLVPLLGEHLPATRKP